MPFPLLLPLSIVMFVLLLASAFCSGSETALISLNKVRLRHQKDKGKTNAKILYGVITRLDRFLASIVVSNNLINTAFCVIGTLIFINLLGPYIGDLWASITATFVLTMILLVFAEITPKVFSSQHSEQVALTLAIPIVLVMKVLEPVAKFFVQLSHILIRLFGGIPSKRSPLITEEEIRVMIEVGKEEGILTDEERNMLHRIFKFGDIKVGEVMVPKEKIIAIELGAQSEKLLELFVEGGYARIPVYRQSIENIIGIIYAGDLLHVWRNDALIVIPDLIHPAYHVSPKKKISALLTEFQLKNIQIAIVVDDGGKTLGLVTLEDLIEEVVGEVEEDPSIKQSLSQFS